MSQQPPPPPPPPAAASFLASRPGFGTSGTATTVSSNHFRLKFEAKTIYHYDVSFEPEPRKGTHRSIIQKLVADKLLDAVPAYDGQRSLYTGVQLPQQLDLTVEVDVSGGGGARRCMKTFRVTLREASRLDLSQMSEFISGRRRILPQECLQALDVVLREAAARVFMQKGRCFFGRHFGEENLGGGLIAWRGFYQSIRPAQNGLLTLNIDISAAPFLAPLCVHDFLANAFKMDVRDLDRELSRNSAYADSLKARARKLLKGIRVETIHNPSSKRRYKIEAITNQPVCYLSFDMSGQNVSVIEYFKRTYNYTVIFQGLPAIESGTGQRKKYLPMEICQIVSGQPYTKTINESQKRALLGISSIKPSDRLHKTTEIENSIVHESRGIVKEFGVMINRLPTEIPARILPPPAISYHTGELTPGMGFWNMKGKVLVKGCEINCWTVINFSLDVQDRSVNQFCEQLINGCQLYGLRINPRMAVPWTTMRRGGDVEATVRSQYEKCLHDHRKELDLLICVMPQNDNKTVYASVKRVCEIELGLVTQCCLADHVRKGRPDYIANLLLKINAKMGGCNALLVSEKMRKLPLISDVPSIIIGADVSHPRPGDESGPSICAVTASMDWPHFSQYEAIIQTQQKQRGEVCEGFYWENEVENGILQKGGIIRDLLSSFEGKHGRRPERIVFYRDGVSEGEFQSVLDKELEAIKKACESLGWGSRLHDAKSDETQQKRQHRGSTLPKITFIVVQKRHHTRFFPKDHATNNGNIIPGTVVDSVICHPNNFDFYLCSHSGIKGTSRPTHYHVLKDENDFSVDEIQRLTYDLCFTYARCTRAVSVVPACYYAHLAAYRAHVWLTSGGSDSGSQRSSKGGTFVRSNAPIQRPLPLLHERIRQKMFYI